MLTLRNSLYGKQIKVAYRHLMRRGTSRPRSVLLMLFRKKMVPNLPATMSGICLARIAAPTALLSHNTHMG